MHPERVERRAEALGRPPGAAQDPLRARLGGDQCEHALGDGLRAQRVEHDRLPPRLDVLGHLAQRQLAQRGQPIGAEEVVERRLRALPRVHLARADPLLERLGGEVDEHDLVGRLEDAVGERLAHTDVRQLGDGVVEALEVLDVDRRDDVDPGREHLVDVLPALVVAGLGQVRMGELVDQRELGRTPDHRVDVHLLEREAAVAGLEMRHLLEPFRERRRLRPLVGLEVADHDVAALGMGRPPFLEHAVGLADTRGHSEQDPVAPAHTGRPQAPNRLCTTRSISLMPTNGRITPPSP